MYGPLDEEAASGSIPDFLSDNCGQWQSSLITGHNNVEYSAGAVYVCSDGYKWIRIGRGKVLASCKQ